MHWSSRKRQYADKSSLTPPKPDSTFSPISKFLARDWDGWEEGREGDGISSLPEALAFCPVEVRGERRRTEQRFNPSEREEWVTCLISSRCLKQPSPELLLSWEVGSPVEKPFQYPLKCHAAVVVTSADRLSTRLPTGRYKCGMTTAPLLSSF